MIRKVKAGNFHTRENVKETWNILLEKEKTFFVPGNRAMASG